MSDFIKKIRRGLEVFGDKGVEGVRQTLHEKSRVKREQKRYSEWVNNFDTLNPTERKILKAEIENFSRKPLISIILPVFDVEEKWLRLTLESVVNQIYTNWELCIADDKSSDPHIGKILDEYSSEDPRIKVVYRRENGHISEASNSALELATGDFCTFLDHDDELSEKALFYLAKEIDAFPDAALIYSDEDMIDESGTRYSPKFKPDWSPQLFYSLNLINHLAAYRTDLLREIKGFRAGFEGSQDYDLALRAIEKIEVSQIRHIPRILYHWRAISGSVAFNSEEKPYAHERARKALKEHFQRIGEIAEVTRGFAQFHRVIRKSAADKKIAVFSPDIIGASSDNIEIIITNDATANTFNKAVSETKAEILIFLESGIQPISEGWIEELCGQAIRKNVGAVGGKIFRSNGTVDNAGVICGIKGGIGFAFNGFQEDSQAGIYRLQVIGNFTAVSSVLAVRRELFEELGGYNSEIFNKYLFEIDFCLRLREKGFFNVVTPYATFMNKGFRPEKANDSKELDALRERWKIEFEKDRLYNPNLTLDAADFSVAIPPRIAKL